MDVSLQRAQVTLLRQEFSVFQIYAPNSNRFLASGDETARIAVGGLNNVGLELTVRVNFVFLPSKQ